MTLPCEIKRMTSNLNYSVEVTLIEGRNRQIRLMAESIGLKVRFLHRIEFGGINLEDLKSPGQWKYLNTNEMNIIRNVVNKSLELEL